MTTRKIVHIDMDAFYASVEQRDDPNLRGKPVVVAWRGNRSVVCAASYEARTFGVRSAMPAIRAERLCPTAIFIPPDFTRYRAVSQQVRAIFQRHTDLIEPLSLDEAYLDVTENKTSLPTATRVASAIRQQIREELTLTASAGVAPNKFLAKIASDWRKPDGLFVIQPSEVDAFLSPLPVGRIPGVGKVTEEILQDLGIHTVGDLRARELSTLEGRFGRYGVRLYELARGIDNSAVVPDRPTKSISAEDTFERDLPLAETEAIILCLAEKVWAASRKETRTVVLKLKTSDFNILTRSHTPPLPPSSAEELTAIALNLRERVNASPRQRFRLVGVGLSNFREPDNPEDSPAQSALFTHDTKHPEDSSKSVSSVKISVKHSTVPSQMMTLYIATYNPGKLRDFVASASQHFTLTPLPGIKQIPAPAEDEPTFEGNARLKAIFYSHHAPGEIVIADDSGLEVDALHGAPGVRSARFAEDHHFHPTEAAEAISPEPLSTDHRNNLCLLSLLTNIPLTERSARYHCVLAAARDGQILAIGHGAVEGEILTAPRGTEGFGYDPLFYLPEQNKTMAELDIPTKLTFSHRGRAFAALLEELASL
jgi:DNA polymerase-4